jgi:regulatory protein
MRAAVVNWPFKVIQGGVQAPATETRPLSELERGESNAPQAASGNAASGKTTAVKARAVGLLAQREYSRQALQDKLASEEASPQEIEQALAQLEAKGLMSDARVAETLVNRRASKLGSMRLRQELQAKGVSPELVAETMEGLKNSELARALAIWQKKFGHVATDAATRNRQARFLATRGFSGDVVRQVVAGLTQED